MPKGPRRVFVYADYYNSIQKSIVERYYAMGAEEHYHAPLIRNLLTEELIKSELLSYLPEGLSISKGEVIKDNKSSGDCDLIIFKKPVIFQYGSIAIVPYSSVKAIIEIGICGRELVKGKGLKRLQIKRNFAEKLFVIAMHGHFRRTDYEKRKEAVENKLGIKIFTLSEYSGEIVEGEFQRLIEAIKKLEA